MRAKPRAWRDDHGAAVVVAVGLIAVLAFVAAVSVGVVAIVLAHRRAQTAADLAALAGAAAVQRGEEPCAAVVRIAGLHDARVSRCTVAGLTVLVGTAVELPRALGGAEVPARARAGPAVGSTGLFR